MNDSGDSNLRTLSLGVVNPSVSRERDISAQFPHSCYLVSGVSTVVTALCKSQVLVLESRVGLIDLVAIPIAIRPFRLRVPKIGTNRDQLDHLVANLKFD